MTLDYAALGFKAGLEIHQQLDTRKLFCRCPSRLDEDDTADVTFLRALKPTASELGEVDRAAVEEARKSLLFEYVASHESCCLVEMDEEPPHDITPEALDVALQVALLLKSRPVTEVHVMRKIVVDGSNTSGFQRTALLSTDGLVEASGGNVGVATLCLEEDSARRLDRVGNLQRYRLDRLGIPLVEIATTPDIKGPEHAREVAEAIGAALRATGRVKRGIGTIRQDLNVSIRDGARVEIKGVQELRLIAPAVEWEVARQAHLLEIKKQLLARGAKPADYLRPIIDVTDVFASTEAKTVKGQHVYAAALPHLAGLIGKKDASLAKDAAQPPRVGRELADYAKTKAGVKGIFHSDELPAYGISAAECGEIVSRLNLGTTDAFALVVEKKAVAEVALHAVLSRAAMLLDGVPEETRDLNPDATSRYLRPLPGGARMYPETDVAPVALDAKRVADVRARMEANGVLPPAEARRWLRERYPDLPEAHVKGLVMGALHTTFHALMQEFPELPKQDATAIMTRAQLDEFLALARGSGLPRESGKMILSTWDDAAEKWEAQGKKWEFDTRSEIIPASLVVLAGIKSGKYSREVMTAALMLALAHNSLDEIARLLGGEDIDEAEVILFIDSVIAERRDLVARQGMRAAGAIMGPTMARYRGKVPGDKLSRLVNERLQRAV